MPGFKQRFASRSPRRAPGEETTAWGWNSQVMQWMKGWAWGLQYANNIIQAASAIDGPTNPIVRRLASVQHERNAEKVIESLVPKNRFPDFVDVDNSLVNVIIRPFDSFHWLRNLDPAKFRRHMGMPESGLEEW